VSNKITTTASLPSTGPPEPIVIGSNISQAIAPGSYGAACAA
jgi:hypothetical protein